VVVSREEAIGDVKTYIAGGGCDSDEANDCTIAEVRNGRYLVFHSSLFSSLPG
jgi:hypothetical protein